LLATKYLFLLFFIKQEEDNNVVTVAQRILDELDKEPLTINKLKN